MDTTVERIDRTVIEVPYREVAGRNMRRQLPHWTYLEVIELELEDGTVGYGEDMLYYGWGEVTDEAVERALGENAAALLWDDSLGSLQIALFDAVAKHLGVPAYELVGEKVRDEVPHAWWCIDMPAEDWIAECEAAVEQGYTAVKLKGRPWFDVRANVAELCGAIPEWFDVGIDFNGTLLDADRALPILEELEEHPQVGLFESPIPQDDVDGNRRLRRALDADLAAHNGRPASTSELTQLQTGIVEGFVLGTAGPRRLTDEAAVAAMADLPFWIQNLGFLTAVFWTHVAATTTHNRLPNVHCHNLFAETPLREPIDVSGGTVTVPDGPGLGYEPDPETVERLAVDRPDERPAPDRLLVTEWPASDREPTFVASGEQLYAAARAGDLPYFERGVETRLVPDDGSEAWDRLRERAAEEPVVGEPEWW